MDTNKNYTGIASFQASPSQSAEYTGYVRTTRDFTRQQQPGSSPTPMRSVANELRHPTIDDSVETDFAFGVGTKLGEVKPPKSIQPEYNTIETIPHYERDDFTFGLPLRLPQRKQPHSFTFGVDDDYQI